jgi:hypothetical protein
VFLVFLKVLLVWEDRKKKNQREMEQKHMLLSALSVGVGVGMGLGLASGQKVSRWAGGCGSIDGVTAEQIEQELMRQVVDGRDSKVTFEEFPYYLRQDNASYSLLAFLPLSHACIIQSQKLFYFDTSILKILRKKLCYFFVYGTLS